MVERQPQTPTVMVKSERKDQGHAKQYTQHRLVPGAENEETEETQDKDHELTNHHVHEDGADEEPFLALEDRMAAFTIMFDVE